MTQDSYKTALEDAIAEYRTLAAQRAEIDQRVAQLRETIVTLLRLLGRKEPVDFERFFDSAELAEAIDPKSEVGLSEAISDVLKAHEGFISVRDVKLGLVKIGFDVERYANAFPAITTTLSRLARSGDVIKRTSQGGVEYSWNRSAFKHSPLKYIGQRIPKAPTVEEALQKFAEGRRQQNALQAMAKDLKDKKK